MTEITEILIANPQAFVCPAINADQAAELADQIERGKPDMYRLVASGLGPAFTIPFFDALWLASGSTYGRNAARPERWADLGLPPAVARALADALNQAAERTR